MAELVRRTKQLQQDHDSFLDQDARRFKLLVLLIQRVRDVRVLRR